MWFLSKNLCRQGLDWAGVWWGRNLKYFSYLFFFCYFSFLSLTAILFFRKSIFIWKYKVCTVAENPLNLWNESWLVQRCIWRSSESFSWCRVIHWLKHLSTKPSRSWNFQSWTWGFQTLACGAWSRMYWKIPAEMPSLTIWTGRILTKQRHSHLLVRFVNTKRNLKFRNFKRSTARTQTISSLEQVKKYHFLGLIVQCFTWKACLL